MSKLKKLNNAQTAYFCEQLWLMLNSGMHLNDGLDILSEDLDDARLRKLCEQLSDSICSGNTLDNAMADSGVFPTYAVSMVKIGGVSGRLDDVLKGLTEYYENRAAMESTVRYAVVHPAALLVMMAVVMAVLVIKVIPMFEGIFGQFSSDIGATVSVSMQTANNVGVISMIVLIAVVVIVAVIYLITPVRRALLRLLSEFPLTSRFANSFQLAKAVNAMSMMISAGITPEDALEYTLTLVTHKKLRAKLTDCLERVLDGAYFADAVCECGMLPKVYSRSLRIAYSSGSFETVWKKISARCDEEAHKAAASLISVIEPLMIAILAVLIGSVLLTIMLPLMNIMSAMG